MKHEKRAYVLAHVLFLAYLAVLTYFLFFAEAAGRTGTYTEYHYNFIPFDTIRMYRKNQDIFGPVITFINLEGNVLAFLPFGFFLPIVFTRCRRLWIVVLITACFSVCVELIQLVTMVGSCDIDDVLLNTLGGLLGYLCFLGWRRMKERVREKNGAP